MKLQISWNEDEKEVDVRETESDIFQEIGKILPEIAIPNTVYAKCDLGEAEFYIGKRGTFTKNGIKMPSMYVTEKFNNIRGYQSSTYEETYLTCINPESNNYKCATCSATIPFGKKQQLSV